MRNKYSKEFEEEAKDKSSVLTQRQLRKYLEDKYNLIISKNAFSKYLYKHGIKCIDYNTSKVRKMDKKPIGYEYRKNDGMILVKVADNKWIYKQRLMYMKYHKCELTSDDYIIFLNQNRNDFSKDNLVKVSRRESSILSNQKMFSKNKDLTNLGILTAKLMIKANSIKGGNGNDKIRN